MPVVAEQRRGGEQLLDAGHPDDVELSQRRIDNGVVARDRPGVRERRLLAGLAGACLQRDDGLACLVGSLRRRAERGRIADLLQEHADDLGLLVGDQVVEHVGGRDHGLVAKAGDGTDADGVRPGEGQQHAGQRPALQRDPDRAGGERQRHGQGVGGGPRRGVEEAQAVGSEQHDPMAGCGRDEAVLEFHAGSARLAVTRGEDDRVPHSAGRGVLDHGRDRLGGSEDERQVGGLVEIAQSPDSRPSEDLVVPRVHRQQRAGVADRAAGSDDEPRPA